MFLITHFFYEASKREGSISKNKIFTYFTKLAQTRETAKTFSLSKKQHFRCLRQNSTTQNQNHV